MNKLGAAIINNALNNINKAIKLQLNAIYYNGWKEWMEISNEDCD